MDPFSSAYKFNAHHETSLWPSNPRDTNLTSHYRFYSDFQDLFDLQPFENNLENPSLDLYDNQHQYSFFSYAPQESGYYQSRHLFPVPSRVSTFPGIEADHGDEIVSKREEFFGNQGNLSSEAYKYQVPKQSSEKPNTSALKGFMDLVNQASSFWMNKLGGPSTSTSGKHNQESESHENQKGLFGKKDLKLTISYPCLISTNSLNNHRAAFESQEEGTSSYKSSSNVENNIEEQDKLKADKISKKKIRKTPKSTQQEKWGSVHDQKLLDLVQQLGTSWNDVAEAFKEEFVNAKYVRERYRVLSKKGARPKRQAFSREEDLEIAKYYKLCEGNWESISKYFPTRRPAVIRNRFYSTIRGHLEEYLKEVEISTQDEKRPETCSPENENEEQSSHEANEANQEEQDQQEIDMEIEENPSRSQEDILDSYFNKEAISESDNLFNESAQFLEGAQEDSKEQEPASSLAMTRKVEDDAIGALVWEDKPAKEAIEILSGRISLLTSLYNQTRIELTKLQSETEV